jgi:hypothetical protein
MELLCLVHQNLANQFGLVQLVDVQRTRAVMGNVTEPPRDPQTES